jgi:hypothetical protein
MLKLRAAQRAGAKSAAISQEEADAYRAYLMADMGGVPQGAPPQGDWTAQMGPASLRVVVEH